MNSRAIATAALTGLVILGLTGCGAITPQATTIAYSASDGVNIPDEEGSALQVRNAVVITNEEGDVGNLAAAIVNTSDTDQTLNLQWGDQHATVEVAAGEVVSLGTADTDPLELAAIDTPAGATLPIYFQSGTGQGVQTEVPVLDGCLVQFRSLVPGGESSQCERVAEGGTEAEAH